MLPTAIRLAAQRGAGAIMPAARHVVVVGGVAGGASAAARLRRLDEAVSITVLERGPYASFANCGLPYFVGGTIVDEAKLLVATPELFADRFRIDVRTGCEVVALNPAAHALTVRGPDGVLWEEQYDACVLATGAKATELPVPGATGEGVFHLRSIPDSRAIRQWIMQHNARHATVVGAGFIGLEITHALRGRGLDVDLIEAQSQVMAPMDADFGPPIEAELTRNGVVVRCGETLAEVMRIGGRMAVRLGSGAEIATDFVIVAAGARPESTLAREAGLNVAESGGIVVDEQMRTSADGVWAVGDVVQGPRVLDHHQEIVPLAGLANRQGRVAAESIAGVPWNPAMRAVQATAICQAFDITMAMTGTLDKALRHTGWLEGSYHTVQTHPGHHASYYPGALPLHLKLAFAAADGRVLGAQAVGTAHEAVARRIDVIATAIQMGATVTDLAECELCYAPQFGSAKDPVNVIGMVAANVLAGLAPLSRWDDILASAQAVEAGGSATVTVLDVRTLEEFEEGHIPGAVHVTLENLRDAGTALPTGPLEVCCRVGQRAYIAVRLLRQRGVDARLLSGGYQTYLQRQSRGAAGYEDIVAPSIQ